MPCIDIKTNCAVSPAEEETLRREFGKAISLFPGKSESWLMFIVEDNLKMAFQGKAEGKIAFVEVKLLGPVADYAASAMTAEACRILQNVLGVPGNKVFVRYETTEYWGWDGANF